MSKNRHELPRKRPGRTKQDEIAEELPTLEPLVEDAGAPVAPGTAELPTLEPADDDGPIKVACASGGEAGFDTVVSCAVPAMDKKLVPDAVKGPLQRLLAASATKLRHQRVLVRFTGDALIGSAVKELVAEALKLHKPLLGVVRRGFGDEMVVQGKLPEVAVTTSDQAGTTRVEIATADLEPALIGVAFAPHLQRVAASARGRKFTFVFSGQHKPDPELRAQLTKTLQDAGAVRAAVGERVLFDRELAERVQCTATGEQFTIAVKPADDDTTTIAALSMVLPEQAGNCAGKPVRVQLAKASPAARDFCVDFAKKHGAARITIGDDVVWPAVLALAAGAETTLRVTANGRSRPQVLAAARAEADGHSGTTRGKLVVVDWPAGWQLDADSAGCVREVATLLGAKALVCTIGGEHREPFWPDPVQLTEGATAVVRIDSEAGKPVELQRAIERRLAARAMGLRGKPVRVQVVGGAALSRTLLRSVVGMLQAAGVTRLEVEEGGTVDVLSPPLLNVAKNGEAIRITANADGRDAAQQQKALVREADALLVASATVTIAPSVIAEALVAAVVAKGAARVLLDGPPPVQAHPVLLVAADKKAMSVRVVVQAGGDVAMVERQLDRELAAFVQGLGLFATSTVTIAWAGGDPAGALTGKLVAAIAGKRASKVLFDRGDGKPVQV
ncbi:MAG: hypothetical protein WBO45_20820, partial [Planctomycetota bacterium]